jgi:hypothetical protein
MYLKSALTAVMAVAYNAPPMLLSNADNLLTYGDKLENNNMIMDRSPLAKRGIQNKLSATVAIC